MKNNLKCKSCKERTPGCHGTCEHYIDWRKNYDKEVERQRIARYLENIGDTKSSERRR